MDMATCVARRTRSRTESYLNSLLNKPKGSRPRRASTRNVRSPSPPKPKRRRKRVTEDCDVEFVETINPPGKHVEEDGNVASSPRLEQSESPVIDVNLRDQDNTPTFNPPTPDDDDDDDDDDVVFVGTFTPEHYNVELDNNVGATSPRLEQPKSPDLDDVAVDVDDAGLSSDENTPTLDDDADADADVTVNDAADVDVISLSDDCDEDDDIDEDVHSDADYSEESTDSSYTESSESDFVNSEDEEPAPRVTAKVGKSSSTKVRVRGKRKSFPINNDLAVFELLTKSIWQRTKLSEEDISSGDETPKPHTREDTAVMEGLSEKVYERKTPRSYHRKKKEKNHSNVSDLFRDSFCGNGEIFDGGEQPWDVQETVNLRFGCEEPEPVEKTEEEKEIERLWEDMALALKLEGLQSSTPVQKNGDVSCINGTHDFVLDEEIGLKCRFCSYVAVEIRDISPAMYKYRANFYDKKTFNGKKGDPLLNGLEFEGSDHRSDATSLNNLEGTVWEYIPGIKGTLFPHQQEGFEFLWKNLAGSTRLDELKSSVGRESGGCIISHDCGSGKTRLTIVFLQSYLERFPDSHPVVIAPASLLLTWEGEFRKWKASMPFYNLNSLEFSGHEDQSAVSLLKGNKKHKSNKHSVRMVKLYSWRNKKSVLGVSYPLYEKLAGKKCAGEMLEFRKMLLELPGLLVLDEGHTPRNQNSCIWKVLTEVRTEKRIILSGTPFQNNFKELSNVLCLTRPAYTDSISSRLQDLSKWSQERSNDKSYEEIGIVELRAMIAPFVHVHRENLLGESLPGLRDCVVVLNPPYQQQKILARIDPSQNTFELEHKLSAVSVHPSLYSLCTPTRKEQLTIGELRIKALEKLRLDYKEGVKTRFLIDFIHLSVPVNEKVLVFSQYIETLKLIKDQISAVFGWTEGEEILFMYGQLEQKERQHLITSFNKPESKSKVLLASTRACSEGIHLVGASRVILLDVVWNPSVERQAIGRAYRIGQTRVVYTYHLMVKGTSEWDKYCKQTKKHHISELVFSSANEKDKVINKEEAGFEDRILDEMVKHEKQKDMFDRILYHPKDSDMSANIL